MPRPFNEKAPSAANTEHHGNPDNEANIMQSLEEMEQTTLFDSCGIDAPNDYFPEPSEAEAYQRLEVARLLRDACERHYPMPVTFAQSQQEAGYNLPSNCRANAVQGPGACDALRYGWVIVVADVRPPNKAAHGKKVNLYALAKAK